MNHWLKDVDQDNQDQTKVKQNSDFKSTKSKRKDQTGSTKAVNTAPRRNYSFPLPMDFSSSARDFNIGTLLMKPHHFFRNIRLQHSQSVIYAKHQPHHCEHKSIPEQQDSQHKKSTKNIKGKKKNREKEKLNTSMMILYQ